MSFETALQMHRDGQLESAEAAYRDILAEADDAEAAYMLGVLRHQRGDDGDAETLIRRAITRAPETARYHLALGGVQMHRGEENAARVSFETALSLDPNSADAHSTLGHLAFLQGDSRAAEDRFKIGRRVNDDDPLMLLGLGNVYLERDDAVNAAKFLARAAERKPNDAAIQQSFGRALFQQGAFAIAEQAFINALKIRPDLTLSKLYLARAKMRQEKLEEARVVFAELLGDKQQEFGANAGLGDVARRQRHVVRALKYYKRALELDPEHTGAINACAWCMESLGDLAAAVEYLKQGLQRVPDADELRETLAKLLNTLGRTDEAAQVRATGT